MFPLKTFLSSVLLHCLKLFLGQDPPRLSCVWVKNIACLPATKKQRMLQSSAATIAPRVNPRELWTGKNRVMVLDC